MYDEILQNNFFVKNLNEKANEYENYSVSEEYNRKLYEDKNAMKKCINEAFEGNKTMVSDITGNTLHRDNKAADNKYGKKAATRHRAEPDHDDPLANIHARNKNKKYINDADIKEVGNRKDNLKAKPMNVNRSKRESTNIDALKKEKYSKELTTEGKLKEVVRGKKNEIGTDILLNKKRVEREAVVNTNKVVSKVAKGGDLIINTSRIVGDSFVNGAKQSVAVSAIPLTAQAVRRLCNVVEGEEELCDVAKDIGKSTGQIAIVGGTKNVIVDSVSAVLKKNGKDELLSILKSNEVAQIIEVAMIVKDSAIKYINGDINGKEFLGEVQEQGAVMISGTIGAIAGGILIPIPVVGELVGSFITSTVCSGIYKQYHKINTYKMQENEIGKLCSDALSEMHKQQENLKLLINEQNKEWAYELTKAFELIKEGILGDSFNSISNGLLKIAGVFGTDIVYKTSDDFDHLFDSKPLIIRGRSIF